MLVLGYVTEWRVPDVVQQARGIDDIRVDAARLLDARKVILVVLQVLHEPASDLGDLERVRHPVVPEDLAAAGRDLGNFG